MAYSLKLAAGHRTKNYLWCEGDSYMDGGAAVTPIKTLLNTITGRGITNTAVGGSDMPTIAGRVIANPLLASQCRVVIWDGSANGVVADGGGSFTASVASYLASIDSILAVTGIKMVFVPPVSVGPAPSASIGTYTQAMIDIYNGLVSRSVGTFDPFAVLSPLNNGSTQDLQDVSAHCIPTSLLADSVHLNLTALTAIANRISSMLTANGWTDA